MQKTVVIAALLLITYVSTAQIPPTPQPASLQPNAQIGTMQTVKYPPQYANTFGGGQANLNPQTLHQQDVQRYNQQQAILAEAENTFKQTEIQYDLPDNSHLPATQLFRQAFAAVDSMLNGQQDVSLKKAIFETENAWHGGTLNYDLFCSDIANMVGIIESAIQQEGYTLSNDVAKK